jgi:3-hydroxyacyl-CoA dehydrogenase
MILTAYHNDILEIVIENPPVNALVATIRQELDQAITGAQLNEAIKAIVIRGAGKLFSGGADITEFAQFPAEPSLPALVESIEASSKPVVAAIHGTCFGGGLEIALACHFRIAAPSARLALPEVKLGLLPGAGGTQRLPRLLGAEEALEMIVVGDPVTAEKAATLGLVDRITGEDDLTTTAISFAREMVPVGPRRTGLRSVISETDLFERFAANHARRIKGLNAPAACIEAVKAAGELPLKAGLAVERALFMKLLGGTQSKALRHVFFAERAAARIDGVPKSTKLRKIARIGVIGAGTMGGGISMNFLSTGLPVTIVEMTQNALDRGVATIRHNYEASAAKGRMTADRVACAMALLTPTLDFDDLSGCDLIIEAVYETMVLKQEIFVRLDAIARPGAILASNTSYLDIDAIAAVTGRPQDVLGLHFFSPANVMKLVEVVRGARTSPEVLATAMDLVKNIGKIAVMAGVCYGFIGNRMLIPRQENASALLLEGATPEQIDRVHTAFGMPMGPFQMADLAGLDLGWHRDPNRIETVRDALCTKGRWGQKTKTGFYNYDERRRASPSPELAAIVDDFRARAGMTPREISDDEITVRTFYTMVNEGAKILEEGIAQRSSDVDIVWVCGYGWPRHTGGPMFWSDRMGLQTVIDGLERYRDRLGADFTLSRLLVDRAAASGSLVG